MTSRPVPRHDIDPDLVLDTALRLAGEGSPVFPCVPGAKRPLTTHGLHDASTDPGRIRAWWRRCPTANLARPTGPGSVDVLDVDVHPDGSGYASFNRLKRAGLLTGYSHVVATPSRGLHVYFPGTDQPSSRLPAHHLDLKAAGGYVLIPPSVVDGRRYLLVQQLEPHTGAPLDWAAVRALLDPPAPAPARAPRHRPERPDHGGIDALARWVESLPEGRRNSGTYWAACRALEQGAVDLTPLVHAAVRAGLPQREASRTVASAVQRLSAAQRLRPATPSRAAGTPGRGRS